MSNTKIHAAADYRLLGDALGIGLLDLKRIHELVGSDPAMNGDPVLAAAWLDANALAIHVSGGPDDRASFNMERAVEKARAWREANPSLDEAFPVLDGPGRSLAV